MIGRRDSGNADADAAAAVLLSLRSVGRADTHLILD